MATTEAERVYDVEYDQHMPTMKEKLAYASGDIGNNFAMGLVSSLLTFFYTNYIGIPVATVGMILLVSQIFDGTTDFFMGYVVQKTKSKWGIARPWILRAALPFALSMILIVTVPSGSASMQAWYVFITYNLLTTVSYTMMTVPYGTLANMMTRSSEGRAELGIFRMGLSPLGRMIAVSLGLPLVNFFGNDQRAWIIVMSIYAVITFMLFMFCFFNTKEMVDTDAVKEQRNNLSFWDNVKAIVKNKYFYVILILWTMQTAYNQVFGTIAPYYSQYVLGNTTWVYSTMYFIDIMAIVIGVFGSLSLIRKFGKRNLGLAGVILTIVAQLLIFVNPTSIGWVMFTRVFSALGMAPLNAVLMGMLGDVIEYGQYKTHVRQEAFVVSSASTGARIGTGISGAVIGLLLEYGGYQEGVSGAVEQSTSAISMVQNLFIWGPIVVAVISALAFAFYQLDKTYPQIMEALKLRESRGDL